MKSFASDNNSGVHPSILKAIESANEAHAIAYGDDAWSAEAESLIKIEFGNNASSLFVFNGTGANTIALRATTRPYHSILSTTLAHIAVDECGAPVFQTGCCIKEIETKDGKLTPALLKPMLTGFGVPHHSQPKVVYLSQCTELGTVYTTDEIRTLADYVHSYGLYLHMDGARLANAAIKLNRSFKEMTADCGVDILSFGGTKNGMMMGETVISFRKELNQELKYLRKQSAQLYSKMRYTSCQFIPYLKDKIWHNNAQHANEMAQLLRSGIESFNRFEFTQPTDANILLLKMPKEISDKLAEAYFFYVWNETDNEIRLVTSWDTQESDVNNLLDCLNNIIRSV